MKNEGKQPVSVPDYHPDTLIELNLDTFLKQRVIYTEGIWLTRLQVIKFVANVDYGVHGGSTRKPWQALLGRFRQSISVSLTPGPDGEPMPSVTWTDGPTGEGSPLEAYDPKRVNGSLLELLATISFLVNSPAVRNLVEKISAELS